MHMLIRCTKALLDKVRISQSELKSPEGYEELPCALMGWQANLVNINRRKAVSYTHLDVYKRQVVSLASYYMPLLFGLIFDFVTGKLGKLV